MSEGLADRATEVYSLAQNLTSTLNITHYGLGQIQATVDRANKKASILRNEIENSVELALNQVSQLQNASSMLYHVRNNLTTYELCTYFRYRTISSEYRTRFS